MAPATVVVACIACFFNQVLDDGETCSPFLAGPRLSNHNCNHCNIPGFLCSCFPALTFVWVATPRSCARLPCSLVICWRNRINCTASIFVAACTPSAYVLTDTEKTGIQKVYIQLGFLLWISLAEAKQWYQLWTRSLGSERVHVKAAEEHTSFPVFAVFFISATSFFSCNHDGQGKNQLKMNYKASNLCVYFENNFCRSLSGRKRHICSPSFCSISFFIVYVLKRVSIVRTSNCNDPTSRSIPVRETNHRPAISVVALQQSFALHIE